MNFKIRPAEFPADYTGIAGVLNAAYADWPVTPEKLKRQETQHDHGELEIRMVNDADNIAMLALNTKLGFKRHSTTIRYVKYLAETPDAPPCFWNTHRSRPVARYRSPERS